MPSNLRSDPCHDTSARLRLRSGAVALALLGAFAVGLAAIPGASASWATDSACYAVDGYRSGTALAADCTFHCRTGDSVYVAVDLGGVTGPSSLEDVWVLGHATCGPPGGEVTASCERHFPQCDDWSGALQDPLDPLGLSVHLGTCHGEAWGIPMSSATVTVRCWTSSTNRDPLVTGVWCGSGLCQHMPMAGPVPRLLFGPNPVYDAVREIDPFIV